MPNAVKILLTLLLLLLVSFIVTTSTGSINQPSDFRVVLGVVGLFIAGATLWYGMKAIWKNREKKSLSDERPLNYYTKKKGK